MMAKSVRVDTRERPYDVLIGSGLLDRLDELLAKHCPAERYAIISDSTVASLYGEQAASCVRRYRPADVFSFPAGEQNKTREQWQGLTDRLVARGVGRDAAVIALGGGVTGDLAGFVAATCYRGIPCVQVPTTLLAMIDSSVGGKTGVDSRLGKNLVGAFHQPRLVVADTDTLRSLPAVHLANGVAEALKHGAVADRTYFSTVVEQRDAVLEARSDTMAALIRRSVEIKAGIVAEDEHDHGRRAVLNFGHTIGHAIESVLEYTVPHGEAVAVGMALEARLGVRLGVTDPETPGLLNQALMAYGLPTELPDAPWQSILEAIKRDKKARAGSVRFALVAGIGRPHRGRDGEWTVPVEERSLIEAFSGG